MDLLAGYDCDDSEEEQEEVGTGLKAKVSIPLPSPDQVLGKSSKSSIFKPHSESEVRQKEVLEKHVKMVENKQNITEVNGKKVCWMYRQGKCRFGKKCRMYHDSELRESVTSKSAPYASEDVSQPNEEMDRVHSNTSGKPVTKKRYGVTNTLEPPKKALKQIREIQANEKRFRK